MFEIGLFYFKSTSNIFVSNILGRQNKNGRRIANSWFLGGLNRTETASLIRYLECLIPECELINAEKNPYRYMGRSIRTLFFPFMKQRLKKHVTFYLASKRKKTFQLRTKSTTKSLDHGVRIQPNWMFWVLFLIFYYNYKRTLY